ncbi:hypothetical protein J2Q11_10705 [Tenacibaculum finnmarkense genomovar finnmarkense]|uniref:hypothetical protein n=2 Tax=Tenacibaculum finnmarkense TaxID=2781243 RepID=UPI0007391914|nr:hypothetical protein [Tenacibaculum finnmarkense]ALU75193.1 hypothetical protein AUW17_07915 [Tenacibaculum dicentrarchi]MBE7648856.1 hypothetical protein [Tenacibaculum finnmarkense genomovar ulcerans]MBE7688804.1 hypothetical protein [Tenacibaculum finnmarkense genomovar ulcerans]MCD8400956.1 hypothetical protein [Tenacibaculum finnmarkense genomovar ulcerans]MCD8410837.1 hypothetical protein [Tenacibaculum finnmarkense genomovar ulcerans]
MKKVLLTALFLGAFVSANAVELDGRDDKNIKLSKTLNFIEKETKTTSFISYDRISGDCSILIKNNKTGQTVFKKVLKTETAEDCRKLLSDLLKKLDK